MRLRDVKVLPVAAVFFALMGLVASFINAFAHDTEDSLMGLGFVISITGLAVVLAILATTDRR